MSLLFELYIQIGLGYVHEVERTLISTYREEEFVYNCLKTCSSLCSHHSCARVLAVSCLAVDDNPSVMCFLSLNNWILKSDAPVALASPLSYSYVIVTVALSWYGPGKHCLGLQGCQSLPLVPDQRSSCPAPVSHGSSPAPSTHPVATQPPLLPSLLSWVSGKCLGSYALMTLSLRK